MKILDGFDLKKNVKDSIMTDDSYAKLCVKCRRSWMAMSYDYKENTDLTFSQAQIKNTNWIPLNRENPTHARMLKFRDMFYEVKTTLHYRYSFKEEYWGIKTTKESMYNPDYEEEIWERYWSKQQLLDFLGIKEVGKWAMINISPNWKGAITQEMVDHLKWVIEEYYAEGWYGEGHYTIESGGDGDLCHAHCMFRMDTSPKSYKSLAVGKSSHLGKGNHYQQLKKYWDKAKGFQGSLKGKYSVQLIRCLDRQMVLDKLDYLEEAKKPKGHTNFDVKGLKGLNTKIDLG